MITKDVTRYVFQKMPPMHGNIRAVKYEAVAGSVTMRCEQWGKVSDFAQRSLELDMPVVVLAFYSEETLV